MNTSAAWLESRASFRQKRGSVLIAALVFALIIAIALVSYLRLSTTSLRLANRTYFADSAANLAEAGLESAVWMFNQMGSSTDTAANTTLWTNNGWTCSNTVADILMESMGSNYTTVPTVSFTGGGGAGAAGAAIIGTRTQAVGNPAVLTTFYSVLGVAITNAGSGYTSAPTVTLSGATGSGAVARARFAATRTLTFNNLGPNTSGTVKVWVAGYDGSSPSPIIVSKAIVTLPDGAPVEKTLKIIVSKIGSASDPGLAVKGALNVNGHPDFDSYVSSAVPGVPPFSQYNPATARANATVGSLNGPVDLAQATIEGNVAVGAGATLNAGSATITGQTTHTFTHDFSMPTYPSNSGITAGVVLNSFPSVLPRGGDAPASDGSYYYYVTANNKTISNVSITAGKSVVIVGTNNLKMGGGVNVLATTSPIAVGSLKVYMDGAITLSGNETINTTSWAGALRVWTTTSSDCRFSGNAAFYGVLVAPNSQMVANGGGSDGIDLCGSFVVGSFTTNGHGSVHWDENTGGGSGSNPWGMALWTELQSATDRAVYANRLTF